MIHVDKDYSQSWLQVDYKGHLDLAWSIYIMGVAKILRMCN